MHCIYFIHFPAWLLVQKVTDKQENPRNKPKNPPIVEIKAPGLQCVIINKSEDKKTVRNREEESAVDY